jgi:hypothetical protein
MPQEISVPGPNGSKVRAVEAGSMQRILFGIYNLINNPPASTTAATAAPAPSAPSTSAPVRLTSGIAGKPTNGEVVLIYTAPAAETFPVNFSGSYGSVGTNPTATATYTVLKNGSSIGTIVISTAGKFTFSTSGSAVAVAPGDRITVTAPSPQDSTLDSVGLTIILNSQ